MRGLHLMAELLGCSCHEALLSDAARLAALCRQAVAASGLEAVGEVFHDFEPGGATGVILLAESHLAVHTWPELRGVTLDAYVCNYSADNRGRAERLIATLLTAFAPATHELRQVERGLIAPVPAVPPATLPVRTGTAAGDRSGR